MARIKQEFELNVSESERNIQKLIQDAEKFEKGLEKLGNSKSFSKLGIEAEQLKKDMNGNADAFEQFSNNMSKNTSTVKSQIRQLQNAMTDLAANGIDQASESYRAMQQELGRLKDIQSDVAASANVWANDNARMQGAIQGVGALTAGYGMLQSSMQLLGIEDENVAQAMQKTMAVTGMLNSANQIAQALNKDSYLMLTIIKPLREGYNAAIKGGTVATGAATVAQKAFNLVAKANPYVMLATAIIGAATAIYAFADDTNAATQAQEEENEALSEGAARANVYTDAMSAVSSGTLRVRDAASDVIAEYTILRDEWNKLSSDHEKAVWIDANKTRFANMGLAIRNVSDAENVFVNNTHRVVQALQARARAEAAKDELKQSYARTLRLENNDKDYEAKQRAGTLTEKDIEDWNKNSVAIAKEEAYRRRLTAEVEKNTKVVEANSDVLSQTRTGGNTAYGGGSHGGGGGRSYTPSGGNRGGSNGGRGGGRTTTAPQYEEGTIAYYDAKIQEINKKLKTQKLTLEQIKDLEFERLSYQLRIDKLAEHYDKALKELTPNANVSGFQLQGMTAVKPIEIPKEDIESLKEFGKQVYESIVEPIRAAQESLDGFIDSLSGDANKYAEEFMSRWQQADDIEKAALGLDAMGIMANKLASGFSAAAQGSSEFAAAAKVAQAAARSFAAAEAVLAAVESISKAIKTSKTWVDMVVAIGVASTTALGALAGAIGAFADGGIVGGTDYHGDKRTVRVNSGEMILNGRQQMNLFNMINQGGTNGGGQVVFKLRGQELVGLINNYDSKRGRTL